MANREKSSLGIDKLNIRFDVVAAALIDRLYKKRKTELLGDPKRRLYCSSKEERLGDLDCERAASKSYFIHY